MKNAITGRFEAAHGMTHTKEYAVWGNMLYRCRTSSAPQYADYGGRGIEVCERWNHFEAFFADMGECPRGMSLERIDVNGPYAPKNCRWATSKEQARNRRNSRMMSIGGETKPLIAWAEEFGAHWPTVAKRWTRGWRGIRVLTHTGERLC